MNIDRHYKRWSYTRAQTMQHRSKNMSLLFQRGPICVMISFRVLSLPHFLSSLSLTWLLSSVCHSILLFLSFLLFIIIIAFCEHIEWLTVYRITINQKCEMKTDWVRWWKLKGKDLPRYWCSITVPIESLEARFNGDILILLSIANGFFCNDFGIPKTITPTAMEEHFESWLNW